MSSDTFYSGYNIEREPRERIRARSAESKMLWQAALQAYQWEKPTELDPRGWMNVENQKRTNSCVGQSVTTVGELCGVIADGNKVQLSRTWAYLSSQDASGYIGRDAGADLDGATRAAERGFPLESDFRWFDDYASMLREYRSRKAEILAGSLYKLQGEVTIDTGQEALDFLGGWTGAIQIGAAWPGFQLQNGWEIHDYNPRNVSGGHAYSVLGYLPMPDWPMKLGLLGVNSWDTTWGNKGWFLMKIPAFEKIAQASGNIAIGRSRMVTPAPRPQGTSA